MLEIIAYTLCALYLMFCYRLRGDSDKLMSSDTERRCFWAANIFVVFLTLSHLRGLSDNDIGLRWFSLALPFTAFAASTLPHACFQAMGRYYIPQKPNWMIWLPTISVEQWQAWPQWARTTCDACGMYNIGFLSALIVFNLAYPLLGILPILPVLILAAGMPIAYLVGYAIPWGFTHLQAHSTEWGEALTGLVYFFALLSLHQ